MPPSLPFSVEGTSIIASQSGQWFGRASMKVLSDNTVVLIYKEASHHAANDGELHIRFSNDYGQTWSAEDKYINSGSVTGFPMNPPLPVGIDSGEPWLYLAPDGNLVLHMWGIDYGVSNSGTWQSTSTDGGATWSTPPSLVSFTGVSVSENYNVFATDDDFVLSGTMYAGARAYSNATPSDSKIIFIKSDDNGATWDYVSDITSTNTQEIGIEYLGNNTIIGIVRTLDNTETYRVWSFDMGATWSSLENISTAIQVSGRHRIYTLAHLKGEASWWDDPTLIMTGFVLTNPGSSTPRRNCIWVSLDGGELWSNPMYVDTELEDGGYGDIFYDPDNDEFVLIYTYGTQAEADLKQYNISITGI